MSVHVGGLHEAASTRGQLSSSWHNLRISPAILGDSSPTRVDVVSPRYGECKWGFDLVFQESSVERGQAKVGLGNKMARWFETIFHHGLYLSQYYVHQWDIETKSFRCRLYLKNHQKIQNIWNHCWQPPVSEALQQPLSVEGSLHSNINPNIATNQPPCSRIPSVFFYAVLLVLLVTNGSEKNGQPFLLKPSHCRRIRQIIRSRKQQENGREAILIHCNCCIYYLY